MQAVDRVLLGLFACLNRFGCFTRSKSGCRQPAQPNLGTAQLRSPFKRVARGSTGAQRRYVSTASSTGRPALRLGSHWSRNSRHQRIQPAGTQMWATV